MLGVKALVYKVRLPNRDAGRGKSGGYRVLYYLPAATLTVLLMMYSKSDQSDVAATEIARILKDELGG